MTLLWLILAALYIMALAVLGMRTLSNGHMVLFVLGIFLPVLWIVGTLMAPTPSSYTAATRS